MANFENLRKSGLTYFLTKLKEHFVQIKDAVLSVNNSTPDANGNVTIDNVPFAENLSSSSTQNSEGEYILRSTGGDASVKNGSAWLIDLKGNSVHNNYTAEVLNLTVTAMPRTDPDTPITATIDRATFVGYVTSSSTIYLTYSTEWSASPANYGVTVTGTPVAGDQITIEYVKEVRGTIVQSNPQSFVSTGWNLYNHTNGYARVCKYSDEYGYIIEGAYSAIQFSSTLSGTRITITPENGHFNVTGDGYIWVTDGNATTTAIYTTWSDWQEGHSGAWAAYTESVVDLSSVMETYFPYGLLRVGDARDEINFNTGYAINRVERMEYSAENLATAVSSGRSYEYDEDYIYLAKATPTESSISLLGSYTAYDHGTEYFTDTGYAVYAKTQYGANLKNKLERDVLTISAQTLTGTQKSTVRNNIGAASADSVTSVRPISTGGTGASTAAGARTNLGIGSVLTDISGLKSALGQHSFLRLTIITSNSKYFTFSGACGFIIFCSSAAADARGVIFGYCNASGTITTSYVSPASSFKVDASYATNKLTLTNSASAAAYTTLMVTYGTAPTPSA